LGVRCSHFLTCRIAAAQRIGQIVAGRRAVTADTDLRLCRFFGLCNGCWPRAQDARDTEVAEVALSKTLAKIKPWAGSAGWLKNE